MNIDTDLKNLILNVWNNTEAPYSSNKTIHQLFEDKAAMQPNQMALASSDTTITYAELNSKANQVARELTTYGVKPNTFIGILLPRSPEMIISLFAILKSGAAYVPLNLYDPVERILKICQTANIEYILTTHDSDKSISSGERKVIILDELFYKSKTLNGGNLNNSINPESPAYIIFTSGTTGIPKGVLVKHKPVINLIEWVNNTFNVNSTDKLIWTTNLSFDLSVYDIFGMLAAGGTLRILSDEERLDPERQLKIMLEEKITFWDSAPQSLQILIPYLPDYKDKVTETSLRLVFLSGDWIPLMLPGEIKSLFKKAQVVGLGGATEATVWSNYFVINQIDPTWKSIPYGKPIQNAKYYILDTNLEHCAILTPGDLYIGGQCLASEYYNDKELTDKKFINDPYNSGGKLYFTGDKAQWMTDGNIEFLGRDDLQVKIRGYRVELGEVKQAALSLPNIKDCIVVPDKTDVQNIQIFLFYIENDGSKTDETILKKELTKVLPGYMVPSGFFAIDSFPMTSNGKINNKALLEIVHDSRQMPANDGISQDLEVEKLTDTEQKIMVIWSETLNSKRITLQDNFFDIGGNSLLTIVVATKIEKIFNIKFNIRNFFSTPVLKDLAELIDIQVNSKNLINHHGDSSVLMTEGEI